MSKPNAQISRRFIPAGIAPVKVHKRADGEQVIEGYGAVFYNAAEEGTQYTIWDDMIERIMPGAFDRAIREQDDVRGLFNHDMDNLLGRVSSGTMTLSIDQRGLKYVIKVDASDPDHQRVLRKIERGDLTGSSFAFQAEAVVWREETGGKVIREIKAVRLIDTGPVTFPAYDATTTGLRAEGSVEELKKAHAAWKAEQRGKALADLPVLPL